ncbi:WEB family protein At2g40480-like [Vicia villosa]|uniref:WEB family protein At2g40480-like n=1 Tax=Vicia villosa TaxID=3911 RepID=UPI00273B10D5|nr:WEB family protein At2g40480-like [Vicia villosa]
METRETAAKSGENPSNGIRKVNLRAEIDTSPPFESVKEAVTRFGGSGPWLPLYRLGEAFNNFEDFDLKKVEEQAAELEKDLIVKELETLDVLEELGATKRIVEDLKQQLQKEALKLSGTPDLHSYEHVGAPVVKEMNKESNGNRVNNEEQILQSPDMILMELKQAKVNLGNTMNELEAIQSSVESLNKKMKKEKAYLERTREKLASKFAAMSAQEKVAAMSAQEKAQEDARLSPPPSSRVEFTFDVPANMRDFNCDSDQNNGMVEMRQSEGLKPLSLYEEHGFSVKTAEMRWLAAKKMEEAAKAAEAIALAEIKALSGAGRSYEFALPEPRKVTFSLAENSPLNPGAMMIPEEFNLKKVIDSKFQMDETNISKLTILKKLEEASEEILHSKQVLNDALNRIEIANRKQHAAKEALRKWIPEVDLKEKPVYNSFNFNKFNQAGIRHDSSLPDVTRSTIANNTPKRVSRPTTSMRDVLSRKQVPEGYAARKEMEEHTERRKVALSQMLQALREDLTLSPEPEKDPRSDQKQSATPRKKFGFIHISLPMSRTSKKRT